MAITTEYDAKINLTVAKEALLRARAKKNAKPEDIAKLERHVKNAETFLRKIQQALRASKKG